jgi:hypothetical protein
VPKESGISYRVMTNYTAQETPYKLKFLNFTGFSVVVGDVYLLKRVIITIINAPVEGGESKDYLMAPDRSLLPRFWDIFGDNTTTLTMESTISISFATAEDVQLLLENVKFVCTAVRIHPPRIISIEIFDLEGPGETKTVTIKVQPLNNPPEVMVVSASAKYTEHGDPVRVYTDVVISDLEDATLEKVTILLTLNETMVSK